MSRPDYFALESDIAPADRAMANRVTDLVGRALLPRVADLYEAGAFPRDLIPELAAIGILGAPLPEFGGASALAWGLACRELEKGDSGLRSFCSVQTSLVMGPIHRYGSEAQKAHWLPLLARGEAVGCFALTEPDHGSDPAGLETRATPRPDGTIVLNGHKRWSTNGTMAQVALVWAQTEQAGSTSGVRGFLVPTDTAGVTVRPLDRKLSLRMSASAEILLDECVIPAEAVLPGAHGLGAALSCLTDARYGIAWGAIGAAEACFEIALAHAQTREQFGRPLGGFQLVQEQLVEMLDGITTAQLIATRLAQVKEAGQMRHQQVSFAKRHNVRAAQDVARRARALLGAEGILVDRHVMRHLSNLESVATYEGTEQIHTLALGADLTGISAFR